MNSLQLHAQLHRDLTSSESLKNAQTLSDKGLWVIQGKAYALLGPAGTAIVTNVGGNVYHLISGRFLKTDEHIPTNWSQELHFRSLIAEDVHLLVSGSSDIRMTETDLPNGFEFHEKTSSYPSTDELSVEC